jgi:hypothetical protein
MPEYDINMKVSRFEQFYIQEIRKIQSKGYGDVSMKFFNGKCVEFTPNQRWPKEELLELQ